MRLNGIKPRHLPAARALLGWTQGQLGKAAGLSTAAVARIEGGMADARMSTLEAILDVLEARGIEFISDADGSIGVVLRPGRKRSGPRMDATGPG